jgi:FkbM family methyltransferase
MPRVFSYLRRRWKRPPHDRDRASDAYIGFSGHADQAFGHLTYSQFGEDMIVANIFAMRGIERPSYLDIGAHHPINISNTALLYTRGSRGINVEANPHCIAKFKVLRPDDITLNVGVAAEKGNREFYFIDDWSGRNTFDRKTAEDFVIANPRFSISRVEVIPVVTINEIVANFAGGKWPDFLSLDIEGADLAVLQSAEFGARSPVVICAEAISGDDKDVSGSLVEILNSRGYEVFCRTVANIIFVVRSL